MKLQLLRNATLKLNLGARTILIDPFFAPKHSRPSIAGRSPNPLVELPVSTEQALDGVELCYRLASPSGSFRPGRAIRASKESADYLPTWRREQNPVLWFRKDHATRRQV
ncbi:hypothetical protein [Bradyrhizobium valentinum]|uniref:hypothetical protein n=1 Tax=Bradyrhizobium valentinum TaxID=1518501 RepID=UPI0018D262D9|nr:hypothetical protein [Bradyrhizobium valentinum]